MVSTTLSLIDSPTPRKFTSASATMNPMEISIRPPPPVGRSRENPSLRKLAKAYDAVDADVMPEDMTVKATRKVTKCTPNALCV